MIGSVPCIAKPLSSRLALWSCLLPVVYPLSIADLVTRALTCVGPVDCGASTDGYDEFSKPLAQLWQWIVTYQIPSPPDVQHSLFVNFFEDKTMANNRNSWAPMELARLLIDKRDRLDASWRDHVGAILTFVMDNLSRYIDTGNVTTVFEQDGDTKSWGGANSKVTGTRNVVAGGGVCVHGCRCVCVCAVRVHVHVCMLCRVASRLDGVTA